MYNYSNSYILATCPITCPFRTTQSVTTVKRVSRYKQWSYLLNDMIVYIFLTIYTITSSSRTAEHLQVCAAVLGSRFATFTVKTSKNGKFPKRLQPNWSKRAGPCGEGSVSSWAAVTRDGNSPSFREMRLISKRESRRWPEAETSDILCFFCFFSFPG